MPSDVSGGASLLATTLCRWSTLLHQELAEAIGCSASPASVHPTVPLNVVFSTWYAVYVSLPCCCMRGGGGGWTPQRRGHPRRTGAPVLMLRQLDNWEALLGDVRRA